VRARGAGDSSTHPRAVARFAGSNAFSYRWSWGLRPRLYAVARFAGSNAFSYGWSWGLRPRLHAVARFAGSNAFSYGWSWGLRPRLYAVARFASSIVFYDSDPGACAPGYMLSLASRAKSYNLGASVFLHRSSGRVSLTFAP